MAVPIEVPPYHPIEVVRAASLEERQRMFAEWNAELARMNPAYFHNDGTERGFLNRLFGTRR